MMFRIRKGTIILLLCAAMWCTPQGVNLVVNQYGFILNAIRCILWIYMFGIVIFRRKHISRFCRSLHALWIIFLICIIIADYSKTNINTWLVPFCSICGFSLLVELYGVEKVAKIFFGYYNVLSLVNLILLYLMPQGFQFSLVAFDGKSFFDTFSNFISTDNTYGPFMLCYLLMGEICKDKISSKTYIMMWIVSILTAIKIWSATCLVGLAIYIVLLWGDKLKNIRRKFNVKKIVFFFLLIFTAIYVLKIQNLFSTLIIYLLGKDLTFTGRVGLWDRAIEMIKEKWFFGWGNKNYGSIILRDYYYWYAHNLLLDILLEGGVVTLGTFGLLLYRLGKSLKGCVSSPIVSKCLKAIAVFAVFSLVESYFNSVYFYIPMIVAASSAMEEKRKILKGRVY